ncbi:putative RNA methyltransferase [Aestuariimicrobium sp. T2.26MG-19.2B]|uniref:putative RNA methyltransferase n=1 Tax=Aestuariimicrobium sp. T2.26MG-19.2B TaxID=3040679 RepID=UPI002477C8DF|nr:methyltransferase domain-containing protein [Aestuariimicrobium sp. T2.26MG-19.2B]CAI9407680.1 23S rRNA (guanine(745)-N(1))-methyltransferase [Aestuariimicrobium sp. T2.26MG-19.2B]
MSERDGILACPVCGNRLRLRDRVARCEAGHSFDQARDGHLHLLTPGKSRSRAQGDDQSMVAARRAFLDRGHYRALSEGLHEWVGELMPETMLDVGCGEGTFTEAMLSAIPDDSSSRPGGKHLHDDHWVAFDISRPAMKLTARRVPRAVAVVASVNQLPAVDGSVDLLTSVMSPVLDSEFARVLAPGGRALLVTPGGSHLAELRAQLYRDYRPHDEEVLLARSWPVLEQRRFEARVTLGSNEEIMQVWGMTPYRWNAPEEGVERISALDRLEITVHFVGTLVQPPDDPARDEPAPDDWARDHLVPAEQSPVVPGIGSSAHHAGDAAPHVVDEDPI